MEVEQLFRDKKQLADAFENYRIYNGYALRVTKSDKVRFKAICLAQECEWKLWASKLRGKASWQIKKLPKPHTCVPYSFKRGMRRTSSAWLAEEYKEVFRLQPNLKLRELMGLIDKDHLYLSLIHI